MVFVIALGGNDGLRGVSTDLTRSNLQGIIDKAKARQPGVRIVIAGMRMPPNMGSPPAVQRGVCGFGADEYALILFAGRGGRSLDIQLHQIHPTAEGQRKLAENARWCCDRRSRWTWKDAGDAREGPEGTNRGIEVP